MGQATTNNGGQPILGAPVGDPASAGNPTTAPNGAQQYNGLVQNFGGNGPVTTTINGQVSQQAAPQGSSPSNPITWGQNVGGTFYDTSGAIQGAFTLDQINKMGYGRTADASGYHSIASTAQAYAAQARPVQQQSQQQWGGWKPQQSNQEIALGKIGDIRQQIQDASTGKAPPLSYFEIQDLNAQMFDLQKRGLDWNNQDELELARVMDGVVKAKAADAVEQDRYSSDANFNWRAVANNLQSQDGLGFTRAAEAGGRTVFADGNQQVAMLAEAQKLGVPVSQSLMNKAAMLAGVWDQQDQISGGTNDTRSILSTQSMYGNLAYNSMGMGAGQGNTNNDYVYGADFMDMNSGGNGMERYQALGGPDWQWQKFHNANLSYGGGNYVGDPNYGKIATQYDFSGPTNGGPTVGAPANPTYADGGALSGMVEYWRGQGFSPSQIDQLIQANGGTLPPKALPDDLGDRGGYAVGDQAKLNEFDKRIREMDGGINDLIAKRQQGGYGAPTLTDINNAIDNANRVRRELQLNGGQKYYTPASPGSQYVTPNQSDKGFNMFTNSINDLVLGGPVGAPGTLTTSNPTNDVFSDGVAGQSQRMDNSGMLDGMLQGQLLGPPLTQPYGGWAYPVQPMPAAPAPANANLLNSILKQYYGVAK